MTTAQTIISDAYVEASVSDSIDGPESPQLTIGLRWLNRIIGRLSVNNALIPYSTSENFSITSSSQTYTMGTAGTASTERATKIKSCFIRDSSGEDSQIRVISEKDFNSIYDKDNQDKPRVLFYDPIYPIGIINFFPKPDTTYTAYIESQKILHSTLSLGTTVSLPIEYEDALVVTLAAKIARSNRAPNEISLYQDAIRSWAGILKLNMSQRMTTPVLPFSRRHSSSELFSGTNLTGFPYDFDIILA